MKSLRHNVLWGSVDMMRDIDEIRASWVEFVKISLIFGLKDMYDFFSYR